MSYTTPATMIDFTANTTIQSAQVDTNFSALRSVLAALVTGSNTISADTIAEVTSAGGVTVDSVLLKDGGITATGGGALTGTWTDLGTVTTVDINGGTLDGVVIGGASAAAATITTLTASGTAYIGDTANASVTLGLTINQGAADDNILDLKSSDVAHSYLNGQETDTFMSVRKLTSASGGALIHAVSESGVGVGAKVLSSTGAVDTTHTALGTASIVLQARQHDGAGTVANMDATGNVVAVQAQVSGSVRTVFIIDEDGNYWFDGAAQAAFDTEDDVALVRAFALATSQDTIRTEFDEFVRYNKHDLVRLGLMGDLPENGGLVNGAQVQRLLVGAIWQQHQRIAELEQRVLPA